MQPIIPNPWIKFMFFRGETLFWVEGVGLKRTFGSFPR